MKVKRKAVIDENSCVACGTCVKVCPKNAIEIINGIYAKVDYEKCIGCGKCKKVCPASIITIAEVEHEKIMA